MSSKKHFEAKQALLNALPAPAKPLKPKVPISVYIQESINLYLWCRDDREKLTATGYRQVPAARLQGRQICLPWCPGIE
ncbi:MAG: hypothetical protein GY765_20980 [bacterium]|nr:hypothetical protein [bacterium]